MNANLCMPLISSCCFVESFARKKLFAKSAVRLAINLFIDDYRDDVFAAIHELGFTSRKQLKHLTILSASTCIKKKIT